SARRDRDRPRRRRSDRAASASSRRLSAELHQRPRGGVTHHLVLVVEHPRERAGSASLAAVREDDGGVAQEAGALGPPDGRAAEAGPERVPVELEQGLQRSERAGRRESGLATRLGLAVPRTHFLAHIAAEDPLPYLLGQRSRDIAAVLDGQVRDAAARVEHVRADEGTRRRRVEARGAGSAVTRNALAEGQRRGREHDADEEVGAERRREKVGVLANPAEPCSRREIALEYGARIDRGPARDRAAGRLADE